MQKVLLLHGNIIRIISYPCYRVQPNPNGKGEGAITQVNMRDGKKEVNSLCDVIILSLLYWCHGWSLFFVWFPSFELAFHWCLSRWRWVWCSNTHMILTNSYTKGPCMGMGGAGGAVGWWCPSQLLPVGCDIHASLQTCLVSTLELS